jgi:hypothetical protein
MGDKSPKSTAKTQKQKSQKLKSQKKSAPQPPAKK